MKRFFSTIISAVFLAPSLFAESAAEKSDTLASLAMPFALATGILALLVALFFFLWMKKQSEGTKEMLEIATYIREGASAYLNQQYKVVAIFFAFAFVVFCILSYVIKIQNPFVPFAFLTGGFLSGLAGFFGMKTATQAAVRTTKAAQDSLDKGLKVAFRSGSVMGLSVVGLVVSGIVIWFLVINAWIENNWFGGKLFGINLVNSPVGSENFIREKYHFITTAMLSFGVGASFMALFARVGGGIFTKAADVGADLVGKVEAGIPEDDKRNPATIADNVGDNVGDVAGLGSDLYESYAGSILASAALGIAAGHGFAGIALPLFLAAIGIIASILGIFVVRTKEGATMGQLLNSLRIGVYGASALIIIASIPLVFIFLPNHKGVFWAIVSGLVAGNVIGFFSEYYTAAEFKPTQWLASQSKTGSATLIIGGMAIGMKSTLIPVITIGAALIFSFAFGGGFEHFEKGLYGIGIAAVGMLSTLGITLATDAYGPIADNAGGLAEMAGLGSEVRKKTDALDSLGNTTAAIGKGFAIGSAALTAMALVAAYIEEIKFAFSRIVMNSEATSIVIGVKEFSADTYDALVSQISHLSILQIVEAYEIHMMNPKVLAGLFLGASLTFFFSALVIEAVGRAASGVVEEVRRQFKEIAGLLDGKEGVKADYAKAVSICTKSAQHEMIMPSIIAIMIPVLVGLVLGVQGVIGLLIGGITSGFALAIMMANAGGAWDNAKKYIEEGNFGGKGSANHKAAVVGDTVGDPFKDTAGPALDILIKLMSMISVVFAGLVIAYGPKIQALIGIADKVIK